jgi:hypothetical protein
MGAALSVERAFTWGWVTHLLADGFAHPTETAGRGGMNNSGRG